VEASKSKDDCHAGGTGCSRSIAKGATIIIPQQNNRPFCTEENRCKKIKSLFLSWTTS
jgi:hypothetical protein